MQLRRAFGFVCAAIMFASTGDSDLMAQRVNEWLLNKNPLTNFHMIDAADAQHLACTGTVGADASVIVTSDGGNTWQSVYSEPWVDTSGETVAQVSYDQIEYLPGGLLLVVRTRFEGLNSLSSYSLLRSEDAGQSWDTIELDKWTKKTLKAAPAAIAMSDEKHGIFAARSLLGTTDGGLSWTPLALPTEELNSVRKVFCFGAGRYIVADTENIYSSSNDGDSWQNAAGLPANLENIDFLSFDRGWAVASTLDEVNSMFRNQLFTTTDAGMTWTALFDDIIQPSSRLQDVAFVDPDNGIAVGWSGRILRTTDGGITWNKERPPFGFTGLIMRKIVFPTLDNAYALGDNHMLQFTGKTVLASPALSFSAGADELSGKLTWQEVKGAQSYNLQIAAHEPGLVDNATDAFKSHTVLDSSGIVKLEFDLDGRLQYDMRYFFRIRARQDDEFSDWTSVTTVTDKDPDFVELARPILLAPDDNALINDESTTFKWEKVDGAEWYELQLSDDLKFEGEPFLVEDKLTSNELRIQTSILAPSTLYVWRVRAHAEKGLGGWRGRAFRSGTPSSVANSNLKAAGGLSLRAFPNPTAAGTTIEVSLAAASALQINIVDLNGKERGVVVRDEYYPAGTHRFSLEQELPPGAYMLVVQNSVALRHIPFVVAP